jgi:hypothetical protein
MKTEYKAIVMITIVLTMLQVSTSAQIWDTVMGGYCVYNSYVRVCGTNNVDGAMPVIQMINPDTGSFDYNMNITFYDGSGGDGYLDYCSVGYGEAGPNGETQRLGFVCQTSAGDSDPQVSFSVYVTNGDPRVHIDITDVTDSVAQAYNSITFDLEEAGLAYDYTYTPTSTGWYGYANQGLFEASSIINEPYIIAWDESENFGVVVTTNYNDKWIQQSDTGNIYFVSRSSSTLSWLDDNEYWITMIPNLDDFGSLTDSKKTYCSWEFQEDGTVTEQLSWDDGEDHDLSVSGATHYTNDYDWNDSYTDGFADGSRDDAWEDHDEGGTITEEDGVLKFTDDGGLPWTVVRLDDALQTALPDSEFNYNVTLEFKTRGEIENDFFGLYLYEDDNNWYRFGYIDGTSSPQIEYGALKKNVDGSQSTVKQVDTVFGTFDNVRIQKDGTTYRFQNSSDGSTWETFQTVSNMDISPEYVGIGFFESTANIDTYSFDNFKIEYDISQAQWCKTYGCYYFDGVDDYLVTSADNFEMVAGSFTVSAWVKQPVGDSDYNIIVGWNADADPATDNWAIYYYDDTGAYMFDWKGNNVLSQASSSDFGVMETRWVHVAGVYDSVEEEIRLYVNGTLIDSAVAENDITLEGDLRVGKNHYGNHLIGTIDDVATFRKALSQEEIYEVMNRHNRYYDSALPSAFADSNIFIVKTFDYGESSWTTYDDWIDFNHADSGKIEGNNSLRFKIPSFGTGYIYSNDWVGNISEWAVSGTTLSIWIRDSRDNGILRIGSDSNNYREWAVPGISWDWELVELDWDDGSNTGSPDWAWCDYFYMAMSHLYGDVYSNVDWFVLKKSGAIGDGSGIGRLLGMSPMQTLDIEFDTNNQEDSNFEWDRSSDSGKLTDWGFDDAHGYSFFSFPEGSTSKSMNVNYYDLVSSFKGAYNLYWDFAFAYDSFSTVSWDEVAGLWLDFKYAHNDSDFDPIGSYKMYVQGLYDQPYTSLNSTPYWIYKSRMGTDSYVRITKTGFEDFYNSSVPFPDSTDGWSTLSVPLNPFFYFGAVDAVDDEWIDEFTVVWDNGTDSYTNSTTDGQIEVRWYDIPTGDTMFHYSAPGWNDTWEIHNINSSMPIMNFTMPMQPASLTVRAYDEQDNSSLVFNMTIFNETYTRTYGNQTTWSRIWGNFTDLPSGDVTIQIQNYSGGYSERTYFTTVTSSSIIELNAFLLKSTQSHYVNFHIKNYANEPLIGAIVTAQKYIGSSWKMIEQKETDDAGVAILYLNPETTYKIKIEYPSYLSKTISVVPTSYDYTIILAGVGTSPYSTMWDDVSFRIYPSTYNLNNGTENINATVSCSSGSMEWMRLNISCSNGTDLFYDYEDGQPNGVSWETYIDTTGCSMVYVNLSFKRADYDAYSYRIGYKVLDYYAGNYSIGNILTSITNTTALPADVRAIGSIVVASVISTACVPIFGPMGGIIVADITFGFMTWINWFPLWVLILANFGLIAFMLLGARL